MPTTYEDQLSGGPGSPFGGRRGALLGVCAAIATAGLVAGCGDDEEEPAGTTSASAETTTDDEIEIVEFLYQPEAITVKAGTEVTWTNSDTAPHTASANDSSFDTGTLNKSDSGTATFDEPGSYSYYCRFHPFMKGTVEVE